MKKINWLDLITRVVIWVLSIFVIYLLILEIFGNSPQVDSVQNAVIAIIGAGIFSLYTKMNDMNYRLGRIDSKLDGLATQFSAMAKDFKEHVK